MLHKGELTGFTPIRRDEPHLRFTFAVFLLLFTILAGSFTFALRDKGQPASIRRPARTMGIGGAHGEAPHLTTLGGNHPDGRTICVLLVIDSSDDKSHSPAIGRDTRPAEEFDLVEVFYSDRSCHSVFAPNLFTVYSPGRLDICYFLRRLLPSCIKASSRVSCKRSKSS